MKADRRNPDQPGEKPTLKIRIDKLLIEINLGDTIKKVFLAPYEFLTKLARLGK